MNFKDYYLEESLNLESLEMIRGQIAWDTDITSPFEVEFFVEEHPKFAYSGKAFRYIEDVYPDQNIELRDGTSWSKSFDGMRFFFQNSGLHEENGIIVQSVLHNALDLEKLCRAGLRESEYSFSAKEKQQCQDIIKAEEVIPFKAPTDFDIIRRISEMNVRDMVDTNPRGGIRKRIRMYEYEIERIQNMIEVSGRDYHTVKKAIQVMKDALKQDLKQGKINQEEYEMLLKELEERVS